MIEPCQLGPASRTRLEVACHEAGHAIVGVLHAAAIESVSLTAAAVNRPTANGEIRGLCTFDEGSWGTRPTAYRPHIAAAGAVAAAMFRHGRSPTMRQIDAYLTGPDRDEVRQAQHATMQPLSAPVREVVPLVRRCWPAVAKLAPALFQGRKITQDDVLAALGVTDGGGPGSGQLSMIRSGAAAPGASGDTRPAVQVADATA